MSEASRPWEKDAPPPYTVGDRGPRVEIPIEEFGIDAEEEFVIRDLLTDTTYTWKGSWNYVELNPHVNPAHVFRIERGAHSRLPAPSGVPKHA